MSNSLCLHGQDVCEDCAYVFGNHWLTPSVAVPPSGEDTDLGLTTPRETRGGSFSAWVAQMENL